MACNDLNLWNLAAASPSDSCLGPYLDRLYGDSIAIGQPIYSDSSCLIQIGLGGFYSNGAVWFEYNPSILPDGEIIDIGFCPSPTPSETPTPTVTSTPTPTPTITSTPTVTPTITSTPTVTPTNTRIT